MAAKGPDILAHIDLIKKLNGEGEFFDEEDPRYQAAALKALAVAKEHDCRLEVNTGGVYRGYRKDFWASGRRWAAKSSSPPTPTTPPA